MAAGIALGRAGWDVTVLERAERLEAIGAGLSVWPNGVRALRDLGLGDEVAEAPRGGGALRRADGSVLAEFDPAAIDARFGAPLIGMHRADLHAMLERALGSHRLRLGAEVAAADGGGLELNDGSTLEADLIVGADGINSAVRESVLGDGAPRDSGIVAFRGVCETSGDELAGEWWGDGSIAGLLPLTGGRTYWYLAFRGAEDPDELTRRAAGYGPAVGAAIAATDPGDVLCHRLYDRPPAGSWSAGAVTLLGDAAHPMLPFLGQGACCALEDAVALGEAATAHGDPAATTAAFESTRVKRAAMLVKRSRSAGRVALAGSAAARSLRDALLSRTPDSVRLRQLDAVIGSA
jgi:2-polyprenyl-6-methoxyphenol hydroxylase-like FAD-dependent oxidoreductase